MNAEIDNRTPAQQCDQVAAQYNTAQKIVAALLAGRILSQRNSTEFKTTAPAARPGRPRRACLRSRTRGIFPVVEQTKRDIIEALAKARTVERLVENVTRRPLDALTQDLAQTVYVYLLEFPEDKLLDLQKCGQLVFFIVRIIINQWSGSRSTFRHQLRKFSQLTVDIDGPDLEGKL